MMLAATHAPGSSEHARARFNTDPASLSPPLRFDERGTGLLDPVPVRRSAARSVQVRSRIRRSGARPNPELGTGADARRHLYDHTDIIGELGRAGSGGTPDSTAVASFGKRVPPGLVREPTDEP
jgi:hypothetical protein